MSWLPIIPLSSFYNLPSGPPISLSELPTASTTQMDPSLMAESLPVGQSAPATPAAPSMDIRPLPIPAWSLSHVCPSAKSMRNSWQMTSTNFSMPSSQSISTLHLIPRSLTMEGGYKNCSRKGHMYWVQSWDSQEQGQESAHLGTDVSYFYFYFYLFLYISDWLTMYDRVAPTRNQHDIQWPVKLRRTWLFLQQSLAN